ncbi:phenylalanyl-tRNA synthetase subunit beta [Rhodophyticola porphyridii]|uniref:phenylalanyl-tRNA synthetase subunit beta n=1 Tax=Rhodophyticola porphyridii TaxID=1852017 RepID=UPI0035CF5D43
MSTRARVALLVIAVVVIAAHVAMWRSDMPRDVAFRFTVINAIAWAVVLGPVFLVARWLHAVERRNAERERGEER